MKEKIIDYLDRTDVDKSCYNCGKFVLELYEGLCKECSEQKLV